MTVFEVDTEEYESHVRVSLRGELDLSTVERVEHELRQVEEGVTLLVLDLSGSSFMDSSGLSLMVAAHNRARKSGRRLAIVKGPERVHRVFTITGLVEQLEVVDDVEELEGV